MAKIWMVGNCVLDLWQETEGFLEPDTEIRAQKLELRRGGNAANSLQVLARLGHQCTLIATLADDLLGQWLQQALTAQGIDSRYCPVIPDSHAPLSTLFSQSGSAHRSIVHYRDLPELSQHQLQALPAIDADWLHLEGRNIDVLKHYLPLWRAQGTFPISLELEKNRDGLEALLATVDVAIISNDWMQSQKSAPEYLGQLQQRYPHTCLVWTRGAQGLSVAMAGEITHLPAKKVPVCDSNAAGDTFIAGLIHARLQQKNWHQSLQDAMALAERKLQYPGLDSFPIHESVS